MNSYWAKHLFHHIILTSTPADKASAWSVHLMTRQMPTKRVLFTVRQHSVKLQSPRDHISLWNTDLCNVQKMNESGWYKDKILLFLYHFFTRETYSFLQRDCLLKFDVIFDRNPRNFPRNLLQPSSEPEKKRSQTSICFPSRRYLPSVTTIKVSNFTPFLFH